jgi:hypothetical protein
MLQSPPAPVCPWLASLSSASCKAALALSVQVFTGHVDRDLCYRPHSPSSFAQQSHCLQLLHADGEPAHAPQVVALLRAGTTALLCPQGPSLCQWWYSLHIPSGPWCGPWTPPPLHSVVRSHQQGTGAPPVLVHQGRAQGPA